MESNNLITVLLCDDDLLNRKVVMAMLAGLPYRFIEAQNGQECLERVRADYDEIDILLLDITMKGMSGVEVCRTLREWERSRRPCFPIIAYTANAMIEERRKYLDAGFDGILTKPALREDLLRILEAHLN